jgi:hypothetical protein
MREPSIGTRSMALVLLLVCTGVLSFELPPIPNRSAGEASLAIQAGPTTAALPATSWTAPIEGGGSSHEPVRSRAAERASYVQGTPGQVDRPRPIAPPRSTGIALLGLPFAPANAPPGV